MSEKQGLKGTGLQGRSHLVRHEGFVIVSSAWKSLGPLVDILAAMLRVNRRGQKWKQRGCVRQPGQESCGTGRVTAHPTSGPTAPLMVGLQREKRRQ